MSTTKYPNEISLNFESGGREAIERLVVAYGFTTRQALANHLNVSKSTLANRYLRDTFPGDWIIQCALETGASLVWLTTGIGPKFQDNSSETLSLSNKKIVDGVLHDANYFIFDKAILPDNLISPISVSEGDKVYIAEMSFNEITDGEWLVEIEGKVCIRNITRVPIKKLKISGSGVDFECGLDEIKAIAKCRSIFMKKI